MTTQVNVAEAKATLSDLVERAVGGEDIVIARSGKPRVRLVPVLERTGPRVFGRWKGAEVYRSGWEDDLTGDFEDL